MRLIDEKTAKKLLGDESFVVLERTILDYEVMLVEPEGIKVFRKKVWGGIQYGAYGYEPFERDVDRAMINRGLQ